MFVRKGAIVDAKICGGDDNGIRMNKRGDVGVQNQPSLPKHLTPESNIISLKKILLGGLCIPSIDKDNVASGYANRSKRQSNHGFDKLQRIMSNNNKK